MAINCNASLIQRAAAVWTQRSRSRLTPRREILSHQRQCDNTRRSHASLCVAQNTFDARDATARGNGRGSVRFQQRHFFPRPKQHAANTPAGGSVVRSMVTVTQTVASEEDDDKQSNTAIHASSEAAATDAAPSSEGGITVTASCAARIRQLASTRPNPDSIYLRLYVDAGGCSGFQYKFLLLSEDDNGDTDGNDLDEDGEEDGTIDPEEDVVFARDGMRVVVDQTSLELLRGSTIDYVQEMIRSSFAVVGNPQSESACGCGSSFAVKNFESNPALD